MPPRSALRSRAASPLPPERGIVHRDLKPDNVFITEDDRVKILDFGIVRLAGESDDPVSDQTATRTALTRPGVVVGTAAYMPPEQVRGGVVDARSDLFALGSLLYESLTGHRAFEGESSVETMHAILKDDPLDLEGISGALGDITRRCLEKRPDARFRSAQDLAFALDLVAFGSSATLPVRARTRVQWRLPRAVLLGVLGVVLLAAGLGLSFLRGHRDQPELTFRQMTFRRGYIQTARFAPDGQTVVYAAAFQGQPLATYTAHTDGVGSRALDLRGAAVLAVSRSGEMAVLLGRRFTGSWVSLGTLGRVPLAGGAPREIRAQSFPTLPESRMKARQGFALSACRAYTSCMQYTIRNIPDAVDTALRRRARAGAQSLNAVILDALARGAGLDTVRPRRRSLEGIAGSGALENRVLAGLKDQRKVERKLWR